MKVYGWMGMSHGRQYRRIVAARSWVEAASLSSETLYTMRTYGSITGNEREIKAATARPGVVLQRLLDDHRANYEPLSR